jgi:hypothetical protein
MRSRDPNREIESTPSASSIRRLRDDRGRCEVRVVNCEAGRQLEAHKRILYKVANVYCADLEDRRDLVQEIVIQLWRSFPSYDDRFKFSTCMYRVAEPGEGSGPRRRTRAIRVGTERNRRWARR